MISSRVLSALIFLVKFVYIVECDIVAVSIVNEGTSWTCHEKCSHMGAECIDPDGSRHYCLEKALEYCNTDDMTELESDWAGYYSSICSHDWCFADCVHHVYYSPSTIPECNSGRDLFYGNDDACVSPDDEVEFALCECTDIVYDYTLEQFTSTHRVKLGIKLFIGMVLVLLCLKGMLRIKASR